MSDDKQFTTTLPNVRNGTGSLPGPHQNSHSEDSDQTGRMPSWSESSVDAQVFWLGLSCGGSYIWFSECIQRPNLGPS